MMLDELKKESNLTYTENGAVTNRSTFSNCLDFFAMIGGMRNASEERILRLFTLAYIENRDIAMKLLFYTRDIREGLGERNIFRIILGRLAFEHKDSIIKNMEHIAEYGRYDDLLVLLGTPCEKEMIEFISKQLQADIEAMENGQPVSLLGKWLPSVNASNKETIKQANIISHKLNMSKAEYRKTLSKLRSAIKIIENNLRERNYTFDYSKIPSKALFRYRQAYIRNDNIRYRDFLDRADRGEVTLNTSVLAPYEIIHPIIKRLMGCYYGNINFECDDEEERVLDSTWNALEDFTNDTISLVVVDGAGSMYGFYGGNEMPIEVAVSLGIYFAERNKGEFHNHFITFSERPSLIEIKGDKITDKVLYCCKYEEIADTNIQAVFELVLNTALKHNIPQEEMPSVIYIISDMEFNSCTKDASVSNFEYAKTLFEENGYSLPQLVFWNVSSRRENVPVTMNEQGVILVSGCSSRIFSMVKEKNYDPYSFMEEVINNERYDCIKA